MSNKKTYRKIFALLFIILSTFLFSESVRAATFPIIQNFSGSQPADWELRASSTWNTTVSGDQTVRMTSAGQGQSGLAFYNDSFSSALGIVTQIRYYSAEGDGADGFSFFLVDGDQVDENNIAAGAAGGALGYARNGTLTPGIPYAYLGVGFDEFGSFALINGSGQSQSPQSVVLRGNGNGTTGYDYLTKRNVSVDFGQNIDGGWRLARITVLPAVGGSTVRVEMSWDEGATWSTVINDYAYNQTMPTNLKLGFAASTGASTNIHAIGDLSVTVPADLQLSMITAPSGTYRRGDNITYAYQVLNAGPNGAGTSTVANTLPIGDSGFSDITWTAVTSNGVTTSGDSANVASIPVNLPNGVYATITVTAKIGKNVISTDDLSIALTATPGTGVSDPSPSTGQLSVNLAVDVPTPVIDSALDTIETFASTHGVSGVAPSVADYAAASTTGVTASNLVYINVAVANYGAGAALTPQVLQSIIDGVLYELSRPSTRISTVTGGGSTTEIPRVLLNTSMTTAVNPVVTNIAAPTTVVRDLKTGMSGADVVALQKFLISTNVGTDAKSLAKIGATGYFGGATKKAVIEFQKKNGVPATGFYGPLTRKVMVSLSVR